MLYRVTLYCVVTHCVVLCASLYCIALCCIVDLIVFPAVAKKQTLKFLVKVVENLTKTHKLVITTKWP